jgi:hypothetical protein
MDNPTHGMNCICMDSYIKELRSILGITDFETFMEQVPDHKFGEVLESPSYKAHKRWIYTLRTALKV